MALDSGDDELISAGETCGRRLRIRANRDVFLCAVFVWWIVSSARYFNRIEMFIVGGRIVRYPT